MRRICFLFVLVSSIAVFGSGCFSYSTLHTAEPVDHGHTQFTLSASSFGQATDSLGSLAVPTGEVALRHGVTPDIDVGGKLFPIGAAFDVNYAFINDPTLSVSVNPYLSVTRIGGSGASATWGFGLVNLLADVLKTEAMSLTVGLKPGIMYGTASVSGDGVQSSISGATPVLGAMGGVSLHVTDSFSIMPNVDVIAPVETIGESWLYNGGVALAF